MSDSGSPAKNGSTMYHSATYQEYIERIKQYRYPVCSKGQVHDYLNMVCIDERCDDTQQLESLCSMCIDNNFHRRAYHAHKNLKKFLRDLVQLSEAADKNINDLQEDEVEKRFKWLANEFKAKGNQCFDVAKNILNSLEQYRSSRLVQAPERVGVRRIVDDILNKENERNLQSSLKNLQNFVFIEQGMLKLNSKASTQYRQEIERNADTYMLAVEDALDKLNKIHLDVLTQPGIRKEAEFAKTKIDNQYETMRSIAEKSRAMEEKAQVEDKELTREMWNSELKKIALKIETIKRVAIEEANRKGNHGTANYWRDWEELASNAKCGWGIDGKHSTYPQTTPMYCYKCFQIYQDALRSIEPLKKEYVQIEERIQALGFYN
ncbi:hypothetical protein ABPG74_020863 [Tetrahymena malaccensis]